MGISDKLLESIKLFVTIESEIKTLSKNVEKIDTKTGASIEKLSAQVADIDKRLVRIETIADIASKFKQLENK